MSRRPGHYTGHACPGCGGDLGISGIRKGICATEGCPHWMTEVEVPQAPHGPAPAGVEVGYWTNCHKCGRAKYIVLAGEDYVGSFHDGTDLAECHRATHRTPSVPDGEIAYFHPEDILPLTPPSSPVTQPTKERKP